MFKLKLRKKDFFLIGLLALGGIIGITSHFISEQINSQSIAERTDAANNKWESLVIYYSSSSQLSNPKIAVNRGGVPGDQWEDEDMGDTNRKCGSNYVYSVTVWEYYGGFDDIYFKDGDDVKHHISGWTARATASDKMYDGSSWNTIYTVDFNANGHGTAPAGQYAISGGKVTQPSAPSATGYTFGGWYKEAGCTNAWNFSTDTVSANKTLYAKWTAKEYSITYKDQGGSAFSGTHASGYPTSHTYGTATALKTATKTGYTFGGWFITSGCTGSPVTSLGATSYTAAITLYAKWTADTYTISFNKNANDATGTTTSVTATYDSTRSLTSNGFSRTGYTFSGWATSSSGSVVYDDGDTLTASEVNTHYGAAGKGGTFTLYAIWEEVPTYTATIGVSPAGYGSVDSSSVTDINEGTEYSVEGDELTIGSETVTATPTAAGAQYTYEFSKWQINGSDLEDGDSGEIDDDVTFTAVFTRTVNKYAVTFTTGSGVTSIYLSTNSDGSGTQYSSGKTFDYGTTVYVFGTLRQGWAKQDSWTLKNEGTRLYLLNTVTTNSTQALGTISAKTVTYTITYNTDGGSAISSTTYTISGSNQSKSLTAATGKDGFTFSTYTITTNTSGATSSISSKTTLSIPANAYGNIVVRADWSANEYTITFYQNDGSEYYTTDTKTGGTAYTIPTPAAQGMGASGGRHFLRWNTASDGSGTNYVPGASYTTNDDLDLYMIQDWCTYEFSIDGGSHWYGMTRKEEGVTSGYATEYYNTSAIFLTTGDEITFRRSYGGGTPYDIGGTLGFENNYDENGVIVSGSYTFYLKITSDGNNVCYVPGSKTDFCIVIVRDETNLFFTTSYYDGQYVSGFIDIQIGDVVKGYHNGTSKIYGVSLNEYSQGHWSSTGPTATVSGVYKFYLQNTGSSQYNRVYIAMDAQASAIFFAQTFNSSIGGICHMDGSTNKASLTSAWGLTDEVGLYKNYSLLTDEAKTYITDKSENEDIQAFFAKYDYVLGKYGTSIVGNFLGRSVSPKAAYRDFSINGLFGDGEGGLSTVIIIVSSSVALLSVTALSILVIKKRKNKEE